MLKMKNGLCLLLVAALGSGCSAIEWKRSASEGPQQQAPAPELDRIISQRLVESAASIDSSLKYIEKLERGDRNLVPKHMMNKAEQRNNEQYGDGATKGNFYGDKVIGAKGSHTQDLTMMPDANSSSGLTTHNMPSRDFLGKRLRVIWNGDGAEQLINQVASQADIKFKKSGKVRALPDIKLNEKDITVREVFARIGQQIDVFADLNYSEDAHGATIELKYKNDTK